MEYRFSTTISHEAKWNTVEDKWWRSVVAIHTLLGGCPNWIHDVALCWFSEWSTKIFLCYYSSMTWLKSFYLFLFRFWVVFRMNSATLEAFFCIKFLTFCTHSHFKTVPKVWIKRMEAKHKAKLMETSLG